MMEMDTIQFNTKLLETCVTLAVRAILLYVNYCDHRQTSIGTKQSSLYQKLNCRNQE